MTIANAMARVKADRPGESTDAELLTWLSQLDALWRADVMETHMRSEAEAAAMEAWEGYDGDTDTATELMIPAPEDEVYIYWLYSKIDYRLAEMERYNQDAALFNIHWSGAAKRWNRTHRPLGRQLRHVTYGGGISGSGFGQAAPWEEGASDDPLNMGGDWTRY